MRGIPQQAGVLAWLPAELHYLIEPVLRCGSLTEPEAFESLAKATGAQMDELARIAECVLVHDHYPVVGEFLEARQAVGPCASPAGIVEARQHGEMDSMRPCPRQSGQRSLIICPAPWHAGQVRVIVKNPC